jgi:hypothetical protein
MSSEELTRRLAIADRALLALRRASLELRALGRSIEARRAADNARDRRPEDDLRHDR